MLTDADFRRLIIANPADDLPRLQYADWLEENGQPERAEVIRVQCELARLEAQHNRECTSTIKRTIETLPLRDRERELFDRHSDRWFEVPAGYGLDWELILGCEEFRPEFPGGYRVVRGFIAELRGPLAAFWNTSGPTAEFASLVKNEPVERVRVTDRQPAPMHISGGYKPPSWHDTANLAPDTARLPDSVFDNIVHARAAIFVGPGRVVSFSTDEEAYGALSDALIRCGRIAPEQET